jgi:hypothetical protein
MATNIWGIIEEGRVVPSSQLHEGGCVEARLADPPTEVPKDLRVEFEA